MTTINLLPWREQLREEQKRQFLIALASGAVLAILIMLLVHLTVSGRMNYQESRNSYLQREITILDKKIAEIKLLKAQKAALIARMHIIQELQTNRPKVVHLFDELVKTLPKGVYLTRVIRQGDAIQLEGKAESNTNISKLMRNVSKSPWLAQPALSEIKTKNIDGRHISDFSLHMLQVNPLITSGD